MGKKILICLARLTWSNPYNVRGEKFYYVNDGRECFLSNTEFTTMKELAEELHEGIGLSGPLSPGDKIIYKPQTDSETIWADGYFGRPAIPAEVYCYESLKRKLRKELESHLTRLGMKCKRVKNHRSEITIKS